MPTRGVSVPYRMVKSDEQKIFLKLSRKIGSYLVEGCRAFILEDLRSTI